MAGIVIQPKAVLARREALALGVALGCCGGVAQAQTQPQTPPAPRSMRPQGGDLLVRAVAAPAGGAGDVLRLEDLVRDAPQVMAWAKDPASGTVRDGSRLNQVLLLRLDPDSLDAETRARSAEGVVAYSSTCTHQLCPVSEWRQDAGVLHCPCHQSEFDPRAGGKVVGGPALRRLPPLPLRVGAEGGLEVAQTFVGRVGAGA